MEESVVVAIAASSLIASMVGFLAVKWQQSQRTPVGSAAHGVESGSVAGDDAEDRPYLTKVGERGIGDSGRDEAVQMTVTLMDTSDLQAPNSERRSLFGRMATLSREDSLATLTLVAGEFTNKARKKTDTN